MTADHEDRLTDTAVGQRPPEGGGVLAVTMAGVLQPRRADGVELTCLVCGQGFVAARRDSRTCSARCGRIDAAARRRPSERSCGACGRPIRTGRSDRLYCGAACRMRAYRARRAVTEPS